MAALGSLLAALATLLPASYASAQLAGATGSVERFQPSAPGDAMFGVPAPWVGGHLVPRGAATLDFAYRPLSIQEGSTRYAVVSHQLWLHLGASLALFDRVLVSADMPFALAHGGDSPDVAGLRFSSPSSAQAGDLRLGARARLYGDYWDPFQVGLGAYFYVPTAPSDSYAGDGAVRGEPHVLVGGRLPHFIYSLSAGAALRASARPHTFEIRAGAAAVLGPDFLHAQLGPELSMAVPLAEDALSTPGGPTLRAASPVSMELLLGAKVRPHPLLVVGAGAGPGLTNGWGTPVVLAVGTVAYDPLPPRREDADSDGILDSADACPKVRGIPSADAAKNGCPPDADGDGIDDTDDACPAMKGAASADPKKNGCPLDADGDGIPDADDACPAMKGAASADPKKNGCPLDADGDGIPDASDACPAVKGAASADPAKNGCLPDADGDGIPDAEDACPKERGGLDPDPKQHGCPHVQVTESEITISRQVQFRFGTSTLGQTVDPVSDALLKEVRDAILEHPEIELIEVQGHTDNIGPEEYNQALSQARAEAVRSWLVARGIPANRLAAKGYGPTKPLASNDSRKGRQENRRVQFVIISRSPAR